MSQAILDAFTAAVKAKLIEAKGMFNLTLDVDKVVIRNDIRGSTGGWAKLDKYGVYSLRFNREAIINYNDDMTNDTIPHEVAHIVCYNQRHLGKGHDSGWKRVCRMLGGDDSRTHDMVLTPAKVTPKFNYTLASGRVVQAGPKHHRMIQAGEQVFWRNPKEYARPEQWEHYGKAAPVPQMAASRPQSTGITVIRTDVPALPAGASKREIAEILYKANSHLERKYVLDLFMRRAGLTKAGAATYYQNFKKAGI